ncbi:MAG TPA: hypothetical protein EYG31_07775 [Porticoccaceae bacterium]|jgi:hypothetical protein|nr:hypothetical protein [Gammaproteobacteria bacterium]HIL60519.1 hypothetical protein [Porticoccaceae bacterium]
MSSLLSASSIFYLAEKKPSTSPGKKAAIHSKEEIAPVRKKETRLANTSVKKSKSRKNQKSSNHVGDYTVEQSAVP